MPEYRVVWKIDLDAETAREAAEEALRIMRDPEGIATVFQIFEARPTGHLPGVVVDLST